jgi:hypothetical protein
MTLKIVLKGGEGSGHRGHAGRPGQRGGSASGASGAAWPAKYSKYSDAKIQSDLTGMVLPDYIAGDLTKADVTAIQNIFDKQHVKPKRVLSLDDAIGMYTENHPINISLRKGHELDDTSQQMVSLIDNAMTPLDKDVTLYRMVNIGSGEQDIAVYGSGGANIGAEFSDAGYASTSVKKSAAWKFGDKETRQLWIVRAKSGQSALDLQGKGSWGSEQEFLLPRGTKFKVVSRSYNEEKDVPELVLDIV